GTTFGRGWGVPAGGRPDEVGQLASPSGDAGADGADGHVEDLRDLRVLELAQVAEDHCGAEVRAEPGQGVVDRHPLDHLVGTAVGGAGRGGAGTVEVVVEVGAADVVGGAEVGASLAAPQLVEAGVGGDPVRPGGE